MSVRVNLLPSATREKDKANQQRLIAALAGVALLAVLGGVYLWATAQVRDAEDRLAEAQEQTAMLRSEQADLNTFQTLAQRRDEADTRIATVLSDEVSLAGLLQDVAFVMPDDAQIDTLTITLTGQPLPDDPSQAFGSFTMQGQSLASHAPGVERIMLGLDKIASLQDPYLNSSTLEDPQLPIAIYSVDGLIGPTAATDRYVDGLPEELR